MNRERIKHLLFSEDPKQKIRLERFFLAVISYFVCWCLIGCLYVWGIFRLSFAQTAVFLACGFLVGVLFFLVFRTGINEKFSDPSLTVPQIVVATIFIMLTIYFTNQQRAVLLLMYFIAMIFGVFRLTRSEFFKLSFFAVATYALVIYLLYKRHPEVIDIRLEILQCVVLAIVLFWFTFIAGYISEMRVRINRMYRDLQKAYVRIEELALHDELTGLLNRRAVFSALEDEMERAQRYGVPVAVALMDIDHFKAINDTHGHLAGDKVLRELGHSLRRCTRKTDKIGRYGGEEFLIVLPHTHCTAAFACAERCRRCIEDDQFAGIKLTVSFGVACFREGDTVESILARADEALYRAKASGRNRTVSDCDL